MLIGVELIGSGFKGWAGGSGPCSDAIPTDFFAKCPDITAPHALPWGSAQYIGLGFSVFLTILLTERFGSPIMKSASVIMGLLVGCIIGAATGYFDGSGVAAVSQINPKCLENMLINYQIGTGCIFHLGQDVPTHCVRSAGVTDDDNFHYLRLRGCW
jgi:xanthine/uracil permease